MCQFFLLTLPLEMRIREIQNTLEEFAPLALQEDFDNAGVQIQSVTDEKVSGVLLCLDVTEKVIAEAVEKGCNMIVSHHPLLFRPLKTVTGDDYVGRCVIAAIKHGVTIYSAHTNLDNAEGGVNFQMADRLGLTDCRFLLPVNGGKGGSGLIGMLAQPMERGQFVEMVKIAFRAESARCNMAAKQTISKVALCGGAGAFMIGEAIRQGADAFITGEIGYHRFFGLEEEILLMELGHYETEQFTIQLLHKILQDKFPRLKVVETALSTNPIIYR